MSRSNCFNVLSVELVGSVDGGLVPIGPVDPIFEGGDGERMAEYVCGVQDYPTS